MLDDSNQARGAAAIASTLLLDLGFALTGGRRPRRAIVLGVWAAVFGGALALWRWFEWLFDHFPGWAVLAAGGWALLVVGALGLFGATVNGDVPRSDGRDRGAAP